MVKEQKNSTCMSIVWFDKNLIELDISTKYKNVCTHGFVFMAPFCMQSGCL